MNERLYIDGMDAYQAWGVYVTAQGWNELLAYPPLKKVTSNSWQEEDGIEADLSDPKLDTREVAVQFAYSVTLEAFLEFVAHLSDGAYHEFYIVSLDRAYTLRLSQTSNMSILKGSAAQGDIGKVTLKFHDDFPLDGYTYRAPQSGLARCDDYLVDGKPFTDYGVRILKGTLAEVLKPAAVKANLTRNIASKAGATYDWANVTFKEKDVKLACLMRADNLAELWRNYDALLYDLTRPEERILAVDALEQSFPCHYKKASVQQFYPTGKIWLRFDLTVTFTRDIRIDTEKGILALDGFTDTILATEDGTYAIALDLQDNEK